MKFQVCITESVDLVFEVDAESWDEAMSTAMELDSTEAGHTCFKKRNHEWTVKL